jgi:hypothetical protein
MLFQVQPMVARLALPELGGAPAVWNSAMVVYQVLLLAGYGWAHVLRRFPIRRQVVLHLGLLVAACLWLPIGLVSLTPPTGNSVVLFVPMLLLVSVGPVILAVSAQAPLMQRWFAIGSDRNPYPLYSASNLGSFAGLLAYPLMVEPLLRLNTQRWGWSFGYGVLIVLVAACGWVTVRAAHTRGAAPAGNTLIVRNPVPRGQIGLWIVLSAVPSGLMLSTTTHLSTDIMAMPLLWAIPLGLYLLSFTIAFAERRGLARVITRLAPVLLLVGGGTSLTVGGTRDLVAAVTSVLMLFAVAVSVHSRLYDSRPDSGNLTLFYLTTSVGGALGGVLCALIAPVAFDWVYEHPLLVLAAAALVPLGAVARVADLSTLPARAASTAWVLACAIAAVASVVLFLAPEGPVRVATIAVVAVVALLTLAWRSAYILLLAALMLGLGAQGTLQSFVDGERSRSYFGVYSVSDDSTARVRLLTHGSTLHGVELLSPGMERVPTTYYTESSGAGLLLSESTELFGVNASIGVVGLGAGTLACYAQPGQTWRYFEIDPLVAHIARESGQFHFLSDCTPDAPITIGDARLELETVSDNSYDLLAVDAFSSDAIPMHLMTVEAFDVYDRVVRPDGVVLVHITNRFINLEPVLAGLVRDEGWSATVREDHPGTARVERQVASTSYWVALSRSPEVIEKVRVTGDWRDLAMSPAPRTWTDDFASVLPLIR